MSGARGSWKYGLSGGSGLFGLHMCAYVLEIEVEKGPEY